MLMILMMLVTFEHVSQFAKMTSSGTHLNVNEKGTKFYVWRFVFGFWLQAAMFSGLAEHLRLRFLSQFLAAAAAVT
jgi:hypothetical protein